MSVILETSLGTLTVDLYYKECPMAAENFLKLCKIKYFNGHLFYNVQANYIAQTGDPTGSGNGGCSIYGLLDGGESKYFNDEIVKSLTHSRMGTVGMASAGPNCNGSQFYITLRNKIDYLDGNHTIFGQIVDEDIDTLDKFNHLHIDEDGRPLIDIRILHTIVIEDPFKDDDKLKELIPTSSPTYLKPKTEIVPSRLTLEEANNNDDNISQEELQKRIKKQESKTAAVILEVVGDIPDAEMKPPDNVLFVCKLNPVTEDKDLELIFSRFGDIKSCEIIRDHKTGDSLQYAFIEFENAKQCQDAYFKMDNTLIDDRRIHVDFSQSVGKLWNKYKKNPNNLTKGDATLDARSNIGKVNNNKQKDKESDVKRKKNESRSRSRSSHKRKRSESRSKSSHHHHKHSHHHHKHSN